MWSKLEIFIFFIPAILGYSASAGCRVGKDAGKVVSFRPSPIVFGIVWPILFACLGASWVLARKSKKKNIFIQADIFYLLLSLLLMLWIIVYSKHCLNNKIGGVYVLASAFTSLLAAFSIGTQWSKVLLAPLFGWFVLAILLNTFEVQNK